MDRNIKSLGTRFVVWIDENRWLFIGFDDDAYDGKDVTISAHTGDDEIDVAISWADLHAAVARGALTGSNEHQPEVV